MGQGDPRKTKKWGKTVWVLLKLKISDCYREREYLEGARGGQGPWAEGRRAEGQGPTNVVQIPFATLDGDVSHLRIRASSWRKAN